MFEQSTLTAAARRSNPWSFAISITMQSAAVGTALILSMAQVAKLEAPLPGLHFLPVKLGAPEIIHQAANHTPPDVSALHAGRVYRIFQAPSRIPDRVFTGPDLPGTPEYAIVAGAAAGAAGTIPLPVIDGAKLLPLPAPPSAAPRKSQAAAAEPHAPVRVGGSVQAAKLIRSPRPVYPALARQARIAGTVRLAARISADGSIHDLRVMNGHPMLIAAAIEAVRQWVYQPTLLNGEPVEVLTEIEVNFVLN